jgi:hypothetical protein
MASCTIDHSTPGASFVSFSPDTLEYVILGQSFTACQDGEIVTLSIEMTAESDSGTIILGLQPGPDNVGAPYNPAYTQEVGIDPGVNIIQLNVPWAVVGGAQYLVLLEATSGRHQIRLGSGPYVGGRLLTVLNGTVSSSPFHDLAFRIDVSEATPVRRVTWGQLKAAR